MTIEKGAKAPFPKDSPVTEKRRTRVMPEFDVTRGGWIDRNFFPSEARERMLLALSRSPLSDADRLSLIEFCCTYLQLVKPDEDASAEQRKQILAVAQNARRLLSSIRKLGKPAIKAVEIHTDYLSRGSSPPVDIDFKVRRVVREPGQSILKSSWTWVDALEVCCEYAAGEYQIDRNTKHAKQAARGSVALIAEQVLTHTGKLPPVNDMSWFAEFVQIVGEITGLEMGPKIIVSGIKIVSSR